jgi:chromosome segregation ATPase
MNTINDRSVLLEVQYIEQALKNARQEKRRLQTELKESQAEFNCEKEKADALYNELKTVETKLNEINNESNVLTDELNTTACSLKEVLFKKEKLSSMLYDK